MKEISIIIPAYEEEATIQPLFDKIHEQLNSKKYEVIFVDDGSEDHTFEKITELNMKYPNIVLGIQCRKNFGKSAAIELGFQHSVGKLVFTMDADLQDDPKDIPSFLAKIEEGYDLVTGWKKKRNDPWYKRFPSKVFNFFISLISGLKLNDHNCGFKLYRREVLENIHVYGELHRYMPLLAKSYGFRVTQIPIINNPRKSGSSKFGIERYHRGLLDALTAITLTRFSEKPLHLIGGVGLVLLMVGGSILVYFIFLKLSGQNIGFRPLFFFSMLSFSTGVQLVFTGLLAEVILSLNKKGSDIPHRYIKKTLKQKA